MNAIHPPIASCSSAVYEGIVTHHRHAPREHRFQYRMAQLYLDLDEIDAVFKDRWLWSVDRRNLAEWRRSDYLGPATVPLADAVRACVRTQTGSAAPAGPIRMLTHLRYGGHCFNPVTFYYCFEPDGITLGAIVAEITNTPWRERHRYVLPVAAATPQGDGCRWDFDKRFHVSPFMAMERRYDWRFSQPGERLHVHMKVRSGESTEFDATLALQRRALNGAALARVLWRFPLMTAQVIGAIHWQALILWLKRVPVHDHPRHQQAEELP